MKILWLSWKDHTHPLAGGAETVQHELARRLARDGHEVVVLTAHYPGAATSQAIDGYTIMRGGNRFTVYAWAMQFYLRNLRSWPDVVIDEVNTVPFFAKFYVRRRNLLFVHQLARKIWFYEMPPPLSLVGFALEPLYLRLLNDRHVVTVSKSTKQDLQRHGFKHFKIKIISEGIQVKTVPDLAKVQKAEQPTLLVHGAVRSMKRTHHVLQAFALAKEEIPHLKLEISGNAHGRYGRKMLSMIRKSIYSDDITYHGRTTEAKKLDLMQKAHFIVVTSVKEGWGLIVTEAASQGTPAIVYDVDGLRDSVRHGETGYIVAPNTQALTEAIINAFHDTGTHEVMRAKAHAWSKDLTFDQAYKDFMKALA